MSPEEYASMLKARLPEGPAWATSDETDGLTAYDGVINALTQEPARIDQAANDVLDKIIPDNANTDLDAWEVELGSPDQNLTDAQRLDRIRGMLNYTGDITLEGLQSAARLSAGNSSVKLFNRARQNCAAGVANAGDACGSRAFTWLCELWPNVFSAQGDALWSGTDVTANVARSPVTLAQTAQRAAFASPEYVSNTLVDVPNDTDVYFSIWVRSVSGTADISLRLLGRDNTLTAAGGYTVGTGWRRLFYQASVGTGVTTPEARIYSNGETIYLSWSCAGIRDTRLENEIKARFPIHTRGWFGVIGEYETLLGQDQTKVTF